jgi:DNA-binding NarL/FixJ family response regulator
MAQSGQKLPTSTTARILRMFRAGWSYRSIAVACCISTRTVGRVIQEVKQTYNGRGKLGQTTR